MESVASRPLLRMLSHTTVVLVLLTSAYYALPLRFHWAESGSLVRLLLSAVALTFLALVLRHQLRLSRRHLPDPYLRILWLLTALYVLVLAFALAYVLIALNMPGQFVGISDRVDSLYYSVTLVATVGFGDIYATGTLAQVLATVHMLFNLVYLGTALRLLSSRISPTPDAR